MSTGSRRVADVAGAGVAVVRASGVVVKSLRADRGAVAGAGHAGVAVAGDGRSAARARSTTIGVGARVVVVAGQSIRRIGASIVGAEIGGAEISVVAVGVGDAADTVAARTLTALAARERARREVVDGNGRAADRRLAAIFGTGVAVVAADARAGFAGLGAAGVTGGASVAVVAGDGVRGLRAADRGIAGVVGTFVLIVAGERCARAAVAAAATISGGAGVSVVAGCAFGLRRVHAAPVVRVAGSGRLITKTGRDVAHHRAGGDAQTVFAVVAERAGVAVVALLIGKTGLLAAAVGAADQRGGTRIAVAAQPAFERGRVETSAGREPNEGPKHGGGARNCHPMRILLDSRPGCISL